MNKSTHTHEGQRYDQFDVLIIGAGLSGIDAAYRIQTECPSMSYAILEGRSAIGGTWDLFRYPGIRSDSDMNTLGFPFEPWDRNVSIADGHDIRDYIQQTAHRHGIDGHIHFGHRVTLANWDSSRLCWNVTCDTPTGKKTITCRFLYACCGYYNYEAGYQPDFPHQERYQGTWIHPQHWPEDLDVEGKQVVVIGSGATAVTLIPSLVDSGARVTMLQRSPTFVVNLPRRDAMAAKLRRFLPRKLAGWLIRAKNILLTMFFYQYARRRPEATRKKIVTMAQKQLGSVSATEHFNADYAPWDQRLCIAPDGDLFKTLRSGKARVLTDTVEEVIPNGIRTHSGEVIDADIIVTATGLNIQVFGGASIQVDGKPVPPAEKFIYRGMMLDGVPNFAFAFGYTNASWTLKCDLTAQYVCRLLRRMKRRGEIACTPCKSEGITPTVMVDLTSGYIQRAQAIMPRQGATHPWRVHQNYVLDLVSTRFSRIDDGTMRFEGAATSAESDVEPANLRNSTPSR